MGVLPPRSSHALPSPLAALMTDPASEILDFYPTDFAIDSNGKKFLWQAVVLLPFIDEERLTDAMSEAIRKLTPDEKRRNETGEPLLCVSTSHPLCAPLLGAYGPPLQRLVLTSCSEYGGGLVGVLTPLEGARLPGSTYEPPPFQGKLVEQALRPFVTSAASATYALPPNVKHLPSLLAGGILPASVLGDYDVPQPNGRFVRARHDGGGQGNGGGAVGYRRDPLDREPLPDEQSIQDLIARRAIARASKDWTTADAARAQLAARGVEVDDQERTWRLAQGAPRPFPPPRPSIVHGHPFPRPSAPLPRAQWHPPPAAHAPRFAPPPQAYLPHHGHPPRPAFNPMPDLPQACGYPPSRAGHQIPPMGHLQPGRWPARAPPQAGSHPLVGPRSLPIPTGANGPGPIRHGRHDARLHPYATPPYGHSAMGSHGANGASAAMLLRQQLGTAAPTPFSQGVPRPPPGAPWPSPGAPRPPPGAPRPPPGAPRHGATTQANQSAAELLRQQLMRR